MDIYELEELYAKESKRHYYSLIYGLIENMEIKKEIVYSISYALSKSNISVKDKCEILMSIYISMHRNKKQQHYDSNIEV